MPRTYFYTFTRDDDSEVTIEYSASPYYPATYDDPAEGGEIQIESVWIEPSGDKVTLTDAESDRAYDQIAEHHEEDVDEPDDERDRHIDAKLTDPNQ